MRCLRQEEPEDRRNRFPQSVPAIRSAQALPPVAKALLYRDLMNEQPSPNFATSFTHRSSAEIELFVSGKKKIYGRTLPLLQIYCLPFCRYALAKSGLQCGWLFCSQWRGRLFGGLHEFSDPRESSYLSLPEAAWHETCNPTIRV